MGYHEFAIYNVTIPIHSDEEFLWIRDRLDYQLELNCIDENDESDKDILWALQYKTGEEKSPDTFPEFDFKLNRNELVICQKENYALTKQAALFIKSFLQAFNREDSIVFRWIKYDNRGKDTYDGGVYCVTRVDVVESPTLKQLEHALKNHREQLLKERLI